MTKDQIVLKISKEIFRGNGKLESFHALKCMQNYFSELTFDDLKNIANQYGINISEAV